MQFKKAEWINHTDVYEVNLRQYTEAGTIRAFLDELPRLKRMGVSTLWFMPITPIAQKNMKGSMGSYYACSHYTDVAPEFGSIDDFRELVKYAHSLGFKVIIDWVANHTGWDHIWTVSHPEYYKRDENTGEFRAASGMDDIIELDFSNPALRRAMIDAMEFWVRECDIDGFRCDLAFWVELDFWKEARASLEKVKTLFWLAESDGIENPQYYEAFDACYTWKWMRETEHFYKEHRQLSKLREQLYAYNRIGGTDAIKLWFTTNHDENSWNGTEFEKYGDAAIPLAVFSFTWDGIPLIYSGQEIPNRKRLMFFDKDPIDWTAGCSMESFYHSLLQLRQTNPALRAGDETVSTFILHASMPDQVLAFLRKCGEHEVLVLLNFSEHPVYCSLFDRHHLGSMKDVFSNTTVEIPVQGGFDLDPWGYRVFAK